jgi:hypothetical protein
MMLMPSYSLRRLLAFVTLSGVLCLVPAMAARGYLWAIVASVALVAAAVLAAIQALLFLLTRAAGSALGGREQTSAATDGR